MGDGGVCCICLELFATLSVLFFGTLGGGAGVYFGGGGGKKVVL